MQVRAWMTKNSLTLLVGLIGAGLLATAGGWSWGATPLWAFSFLIFVPPLVRIGLALCVIGVTIVVLTTTIKRINLPLMTFSTWLVWPAGLLFWLLREQTWHGDAQLKLQLLSTRTLQTDPYVWKEPLDSLIVYSLVALLRPLGIAPQSVVALLSVVAGMIYVAAVLDVTKRLGGSTLGPRTWILISLMALGSSQLWFGHIENYSLVTAVSFAAVVLAIGYGMGKTPLWAVGLTAGLAVSLHPQAAFTLPALLLLLDRQRWPRQVAVLLGSGLVGPLLTVSGMLLLNAPWPNVANGYAGDPQLFLTPAQMLAPHQLLDAFNNLWLLTPLAPLWLGLGAWALFQPRLRRDRIFRYLTGVALGLLVYHFTFQNDLARPRDWDLFAIVGPPVTLWGLYIWLQHGQERTTSKPWPLLSVGLIAPALTFALLFTGAWVGVNHFRTLIRPNADQRAIYQRYRLLDLRELLDTATQVPATPICAEAVGCERVAAQTFTMPQDGDERPVIFAHAPVRIEFPLTVPQAPSFLWLSPALDPLAWGWGGDGVTFQVAVRSGDQEEVLWSRHLAPDQPADLDWQEALVPLDAYRGESVYIILATLPGPADNEAGDRAGWGLPWLMRGTPDMRFEE